MNERKDTLRGWKEIAAYVGREVRTVQRWEVQRGLPVRRLAGSDRGNVFALIPELDEWMHPSVKSQPDSGTSPVPPLEVNVSGAVSSKRAWGWNSPGMLSLAIAAAILLTTFFLGFRVLHERRNAASSPSDPAQRSPSRTADPDTLYLKGMYLMEKRTPDSLLAAKQTFLELTGRDPRNASYWSALAETTTILASYGIEVDAGANARAVAAAQRAMVLNPSLAEPHAVLGFADFFWIGQPWEADAEFQKALRLDATSVTTRNWYGLVLTYQTRYTEALAQLNEAQRLAPSSTAVLSSRAFALGLSGHRDQALHLLEETEGRQPIPSTRFVMGELSLIAPRNPALMLQQRLELAVEDHADSRVRLYEAAEAAFRHGGERAMWHSIISSNMKNGEGDVDPLVVAEAYTALGEDDSAIQVIDRTRQKPAFLYYVAMAPMFNQLRNDPRLQRILLSKGELAHGPAI